MILWSPLVSTIDFITGQVMVYWTGVLILITIVNMLFLADRWKKGAIGLNKGKYNALFELCEIVPGEWVTIKDGSGATIIKKCQLCVNGDTYRFYFQDESGNVLHVLADEIMIGLATGQYKAEVI